MGHHGPSLLDELVEVGERPEDGSRRIHRLEVSRLGGQDEEAAEGVDQGLHPVGPLDRVVDILVGLLIQSTLVPLGQQLHVAGDHAEGLLEVVSGDVGELLELAVGAGQLLGPLGQRLVRPGAAP